MVSAGLRVVGTLFMDRLDANLQPTGWLKVDNATTLSIQPKSKTETRQSTEYDTLGQVLDIVSVQDPADLKLKLNGIDHDILAMALLGDSEDSSQGAGTVTAETIIAKLDRYVDLAKKNISATDLTIKRASGTPTSAAKTGGNTGNGTLTMDATTPRQAGCQVGVYTVRCTAAATDGGTFAVTDPGGHVIGTVAVGSTFSTQLKFAIADSTTDYVIGDGFDITVAGTALASTDYSVDYQEGMVEVLSTGTGQAGEALSVGYTYATITRAMISGATQPTIKARVRLKGVNLPDNRKVIVNIDEATITPDMAVDFISTKMIELGFSGFMRTLPGKTSPFSIDWRE